MKINIFVSLIISIIVSVAYGQGEAAKRSVYQEHEGHAARQHDHQKQTGQTNKSHDEHLAGVNERGDRAMGFSHEKTTHHFRLTPEGGLIEVTANDPEDSNSRDQIRNHLAEIARSFSQGDFAKPRLTHDRVPPGVSAMVRLKSQIDYTYEEMGRGGRVRITTRNSEARDAVHEFLKFQIQDHKTGDPLEVK